MRFPRAAVLLVAALAAGGCRRAQMADAAASRTPPLASPAPAPVQSDAYRLTPGERAAVESFLKAHADLRMAADGDARSADTDLARLYGVYHPYFVRGDLNDDGVLDFILAFVRRDSPPGSPWFSVVVFAGREKDGFGPGILLERDVSLANGDLSVDRDAIVITPDTSDDANRRYRWDAVHRQFRFVSEDDEPVESPPVSRTGFAYRVSGVACGARS